jgi:hypothetical protein
LFASFSYTLYKFSSDERDIDEITLCDDDEVDVMECDEKYVISPDIRKKMSFDSGAQG